MIKYKLTTQELTTYKGFAWEIGKLYTIDKMGAEMCSDQVFHAYASPPLAVLHNPIHANIANPRLWQAACDVVISDGMKCGAKSMTLIRELPLPVVTLNQRVAYGIYCALTIYTEPAYVAWAARWLSGEDRSFRSALVTSRAAWAAHCRAGANCKAAAHAADAAVSCAEARAAWVTNESAWAAEEAAGIELQACAEKAMTVVNP